MESNYACGFIYKMIVLYNRILEPDNVDVICLTEQNAEVSRIACVNRIGMLNVERATVDYDIGRRAGIHEFNGENRLNGAIE